jgi:hypothetical protein
VVVQKKKKPLFKTASDGRLIITEGSSGSEVDSAKDVDSGKFILRSQIFPVILHSRFLIVIYC